MFQLCCYLKEKKITQDDKRFVTIRIESNIYKQGHLL